MWGCSLIRLELKAWISSLAAHNPRAGECHDARRSYRSHEPGRRGRAGIAALRDPSLFERLPCAANAAGMSAGEYAAFSVRSFANTAGDEARLAIIGRCQARSDPGLAALAYILEAGLSDEKARS